MFCLVFRAWVVFGWLGALLLRGGAECLGGCFETLKEGHSEAPERPESSAGLGTPCKGGWLI